MANYQYDESGILASYFILTFLSLILVPLTLSFIPLTSSKAPKVNDCDCKPCQDKRARLKRLNQASIFGPQLGGKVLLTSGGWALFAFLAYKLYNTKTETTVYDPFAILGLSSSTPEKEIKRHYKKLSLKFHPDKVKLAVNQTLEQASAYFVDLTKAYKALTDEEIRQNLEKFGHPDGKQDFSMGLALPKWVVESKNNIWILGAYGIIFGGALPMLVGRWWFGSRKYTKDGVLPSTAETFFKDVREETPLENLIAALSKVWGLEGPHKVKNASDDEESLRMIEDEVRKALGTEKWTAIRKAASTVSSSSPAPVLQPTARRALLLLYAHLLRIPIPSALQHEQNALLLATPTLLTSMLSMTLAHSWLSSTLNVMHLHAHLAQALAPGKNSLLQYPMVEEDEANRLEVSPNESPVADFVGSLEGKNDSRAGVIKKIADRCGKLDVVDARFKVIGERIVTPGAFVQLLFKVRLAPSSSPPPSRAGSPEGAKSDITLVNENGNSEGEKKRDKEDEAEMEFLNDKKEAEPLDPADVASATGYAHSPYWPSNRKPQWWVMVGDQKLNRVIVPPMKISDVPYSNPSKAKNYRMYKLQFQAPPSEGVFTFQLHFVSDTFVGEDVRRHVVLKVEELTEENDDDEDDISEPEEDSLAGQMAVMRGGKVKRSPYHGDDSDSYDSYDSESGTDDDDDSSSSSDSD